MELTVRQEHFLTMLASCWESARMGHFEVLLALDDGEVVIGVPQEQVVTDPELGIDSTGLAPLILLGERVVDPLTVQRYSVTRPD